MILRKGILRDFSGSPVVKNLPSNAWDMSLTTGQETKIPTGKINK